MSLILNFPCWQRIKIGFSNTLLGLSGSVFNLIISLSIVRLFSADLWGRFTELFLIALLFNLITSWGNKDFLLRQFSIDNQLIYHWQTSILNRLCIFCIISIFIPLFPALPTSPISFLGWMIAQFLHRSFDSVLTFERKFKEALLIEFTGFALFILLLWLNKNITLSTLIFFYATSISFKAILYGFLFRKTLFKFWLGKIDSNYLIISLPYFLPSFVGFLEGKADAFVIAIKLTKPELGKYYLLTSLTSYCHILAILVITPFLKNFYRIKQSSLQKIKQNFLMIGLLWSVISIAGVYFVIEFLYQLHFTIAHYLLAWSTLPPFFIYFLMMHQFIRNNKPYRVVIINLAVAIINLITSFILVNHFGFTGGLMSCSIMQWMLMFGFLVVNKSSKTNLSEKA